MVLMTERNVEFDGFDFMEADFCDILVFKDAVEGRTPYNSDEQEIDMWEDFLIHWLNGATYEDKSDYMWTMFQAFRDTFGYTGDIWRGVIVSEQEELYPLPVACYSSEREVAVAFAGLSEVYGSYTDEELEGSRCTLLNVKADRALALDKLLERIFELTQNTNLKNEITMRAFEQEKVYPTTNGMLSLVQTITREKEMNWDVAV